MMINKTYNYECCMCGDQGLSHELFRCKVCHFRSQHRYCSNLYPKAESYRVCNWCLIQRDDSTNNNITTTTTTTTTTNDNSSNSSSPENLTTKRNTKSKLNNSNHVAGKKAGAGPKGLQPTSPIKKPARSPEARSPSTRKRITAVNSSAHDDRLRRTKSSSEIVSNNPSKTSGGGGGPAVIKHVFRNKVRRYKLLDEVSS